MIKIYDTNHKFLALLDVVNDCYTEETLNTGLRTLSFSAPLTDENIRLFAKKIKQALLSGIVS